MTLNRFSRPHEASAAAEGINRLHAWHDARATGEGALIVWRRARTTPVKAYVILFTVWRATSVTLPIGTGESEDR